MALTSGPVINITIHSLVLFTTLFLPQCDLTHSVQSVHANLQPHGENTLVAVRQFEKHIWLSWRGEDFRSTTRGDYLRRYGLEVTYGLMDGFCTCVGCGEVIYVYQFLPYHPLVRSGPTENKEKRRCDSVKCTSTLWRPSAQEHTQTNKPEQLRQGN